MDDDFLRALWAEGWKPGSPKWRSRLAQMQQQVARLPATEESAASFETDEPDDLRSYMLLHHLKHATRHVNLAKPVHKPLVFPAPQTRKVSNWDPWTAPVYRPLNTAVGHQAGALAWMRGLFRRLRR